MKRIVSITLLALLLYNAFGYYMLFAYASEQARIVSLQNLPESAFQVIKFNLALYTSVENSDFEYVNQELSVGGKNYNIVKKRVINDTLYTYYLRNFKQDELRQNFNDIVETQTLNAKSDNNKPIKLLLKSFLKDYIPNDISILVVRYTEKLSESNEINVEPKTALMSPYLQLHSPPPEYFTKGITLC